MEGYKFDPKKLEKLNDPERLKDIPPGYIWEKLNMKSTETVIDIGAGTGFFSIRFAEMPSVRKVYALDIADQMIHWMKENITPKYPQIIPKKVKEADIELPDNEADVIIMINVHHEFHAPLKTINESYRLLKKGGKMAIIDWAKKDMEHGPPITKRYTIEEIKKQIQVTKFKNLQTHEDMPNHFLIIAEKQS